MSPGCRSRLAPERSVSRGIAPSGRLVGPWRVHEPSAAWKCRIGPWPPLWNRTRCESASSTPTNAVTKRSEGSVSASWLLTWMNAGLEIGVQPERHSEHRLHLRDRQRRGDAMARGVRQHHEQAAVDGQQVEGVAAGQLGGLRHAEDVVTRERRHQRRQRAHLHHPRQLELVAQPLALQQRLGHADALQRHRALRRECHGEGLVVVVEDAPRLVQHLHDADERIVVVDQRQRQRAAGAVPGFAVDARVEPRVGVAVGHVDDFPAAGAGSDQPRRRGNPDGRGAGRHLQDQFIPGGVVEPDRAAIGREHLLRGGHHFREHRHQVERRRKRSRDIEDGLEIADRKGTLARARTHRARM